MEILSYALVLTSNHIYTSGATVGWCRLTASKPVLKAKRLWFQRLKLYYDETLSNFAFNFNLGRYTTGTNAAVIRGALRAEMPDLLTVVLPQSRSKQPEESQELLEQVLNVVEMPQNDNLPLGEARLQPRLTLLQTGKHLGWLQTETCSI